MNRRTSRLLVALAVLLGAVVRLSGINDQALWLDEALTVHLSRLPLERLLLEPFDPTPGLFYALQHLLVTEPSSAGAARALAAALGIASIVAAGWLGRAAHSRAAGAVLALLIAVHPVFVDHAIEARAYAMLLLGITLSAAGALAAHRSHRTQHFVLCALGAVLAAHAHAVGMLWAAQCGLLLLVLTWRKRPVAALMTVAAIGLGALPAFIQVMGHLQSTGSTFAWLTQPSFGRFRALWLFVVTAPGPVPTSLSESTSFIASLLILAAAGATLWAARRGGRPIADRAAWTMVALLLAQPLLLWLIGFVASPVVLVRTAQFAGLGAMLALAIGLARIGRAWLAAVWIVGYAGLTFTLGPSRPKEDWRSVAALVGDGAPIAICPHYSAPALDFALREEGRRRGPLGFWRERGGVDPAAWPLDVPVVLDQQHVPQWVMLPSTPMPLVRWWVADCDFSGPPRARTVLTTPKRRGIAQIAVRTAP